MDPVSELLSQPFRLEKTTTPTLSGVAVERLNTVREFAPSEKLLYMTYDQVMSDASDVYSPSDFATVGQRIRDNVVKAIETRFPVVGEKYTLKVENVHYEKPKQTAIKEEKEVILNDGSLNDRLKGTWVLYDNATGEEVSRKNATLLNVPRMTSRGTFIRNGSEIGLKHMFRLRSGVYTHIKNNGRVSAHINPEQTTGQQMSVEMEPSTGVFSISRGTRTYGLLPILKAAGVSDDAVKAYMGEDLYKANYDKYGKLMGSDSQMEEYRKVWAENMAPIKLDAETTESTLGKGFSKMDPDVLLRASGRILQVSKTMSDNDTDDRDSLRYQRVMGPADYIPERIVRDGGGLLRKLFNTVTKSGNLDAVVTGAFQPHVDSVFLDDKHAGYIDGSSPMEALDFANMISRIGEGGIGSLRAAPAETRGVNDSYLGFIDPIRSPESLKVGLDIYLTHGIMKDSSGKLYNKFKDKRGTPIVVPMDVTSKSIVATPEFYDPKGDPNEFIPAMYHGKGIEYVKRKDVDFYVDNSNTMMSVGAGMIPLIGGIRSNRTLMGSKYANQAVALQEPEAPLVQRKMVDSDGNETTTEKFISRQLGAKYAPVAGKVIKVDADYIVIAGRDGQKHTIDLYNEYPANQKGFIHNTALVKPGDKVEPNQILAKSNYTDDEGTAALGKNLNVAYMTGRNAGTFEDSIVISESAAKKMASTQLYKLRGDTSDDIEYSKSRYLSLFKDDFTPEQLDKIDENGLPKPGVVFNMGDPVYLGVQTRDIGVHGLAKNAAVPYVTRWEHSAPGTVTNVVQGKKHLTVYTKAITPMEIGDKLCFDDQTEILTDSGWRLFKDLNGKERVLTMDVQTCDTWMTAYSEIHSYRYKGKMYSLKTKYLDICTTPDHEHLVSVSTHNQYVARLNSKQIIGNQYFHIVGQDVCNPYNYKPSQTEETEEGWVDYDGRVYCVTVPHTHTVFVRRNGKTVWSCNSSRYGNKGTVGEILPDEEMPKDSDGNTFDVLLSPLGIPSRCYDKDTEFLVQGKGWRMGSEVLETDLLYCFDPVTMTGRFDKQLEPMYKKRYKGIMFGYQNRCTDFLVTPGHKVYARTDYKGSQYKETIIDDVYNKRYIFPAVCRMSSWPENAEPFHLPTIDINKRDSYTTDDDIVYDAHDWASFMGWYLSEGNTTYVNYGHREDGSVVSPNYRVHIAQDANVHPEEAAIIDELLTRMGLTYSYGEHNKQFHISGKRLAHYLKQFGNCYEKYIPDWLFNQPESVIDAFLDAIWLGDGTNHLDTQSKRGLYKPGTQTFVKSITLASERLIDQIQILFSMKGIKTVKTVVPPDKRHKGAHPLYYLGVSTRDAGVSCTRDRKGQSLHPQWYTKEYNDMVYCPTVPPGYVLTRRNGRVICLGNTNTSVLAELTLSKIAAKRGVKYVLPDFLDESIIDYVDRELKKYGIEPDEDVYDPVTGKTVPKIQTGKMFFYKLKHMAELKERGRSTGTYSAEDVPLKGAGAARRLGGMESSAVFSGWGMEVLRDAKIVRGQRNDEFWRDYRSGKYPETPGFPLVHQKFFAHLKAAGVNLEDRGDRVHLYGATDSNMKELTGNRKVTKAATFESKNMQPIAGGLFDPTIFGADGDQWGYVDLPEPVLNPIMFKTVGSVLGWKDKELTEYLEGSRELNGKFGTQNLIDTLNNIDLPKELAKAKQVLKSDSTTLEQRDMARKRIRAIEPMIREGKKPSDFFFTRMPILPPRFRPVTAMSNGVGIAADANFLYKRMMDAAEDLREAKEVLPEEMQLDARKQLYSTVNAVTGLTPTDDPKLEAKGVAGVLKWAFGKGSPKCYDPETEILTERGWIKFPEYVDMQDYDLPVMTFNPQRKDFEFQLPGRIFSKEYKGDMVHTVTDCIDTCVTSDHMHYVSRWDATKLTWDNFSRRPAHIVTQAIDIFRFIAPVEQRISSLFSRALMRLANEYIDDSKKDTVSFIKPSDLIVDCRVVSGSDSKFVPYDGLVYCVTVPNGLIVTRRNGKTIVSGNCGSLHRKVFGANLDLGSLGTITPDNSLTIDQVGIPERSAWKMFEPFVVRKLVQQGASVVDAMKGVLDQTDEARRALIDVMKDRPVLLNRAPTLWRYGIQGFYGVLSDTNAIRVNPNICKVFNADMDGDSMTTHVPVSKEAVKAIDEKMLPSRNLLSPIDMKAHFIPVAEFTQGLYLASRTRNEAPIRFKTKEDMMAALNRGEIKIDTPVVIG